MDQLHKKLMNKKGLYAAYHKHRYHQGLQLIILLLVVFTFGALITDRIHKPAGLDGLSSEAAGTALPLQLTFTHPEAALQPTTEGKGIRVLYDFSGKLYSGYGDWNVNTGPIKICPYDPIAKSLACEKDAANPASDFLMRNEQIAVYKNINGFLYVPSIDPGGGGNHEYAYRTPAGTWVGANSPFQLVHAFDLVNLDSRGMWMFGSAPGCCRDNAVAYHSRDGGLTWENVSDPSHLDLPPTATSQGFNRLYFGAAYKSKIYTQSNFYSSSRVFDPAVNTWSVGPNLFKVGKISAGYGSQAQEFAGKLVYSTGYPGIAGKLFVFDGSVVVDGFKSARNVYSALATQVQGNYFYALAHTKNGPAIIRTSDLVNWQTGGNIALPGESPLSMRILNDQVYIGTTNAKVYSAPLPAFSTLR